MSLPDQFQALSLRNGYCATGNEEFSKENNLSRSKLGLQTSNKLYEPRTSPSDQYRVLLAS